MTPGRKLHWACPGSESARPASWQHQQTWASCYDQHASSSTWSGEWPWGTPKKYKYTAFISRLYTHIQQTRCFQKTAWNLERYCFRPVGLDGTFDRRIDGSDQRFFYHFFFHADNNICTQNCISTKSVEREKLFSLWAIKIISSKSSIYINNRSYFQFCKFLPIIQLLKYTLSNLYFFYVFMYTFNWRCNL